MKKLSTILLIGVMLLLTACGGGAGGGNNGGDTGGGGNSGGGEVWINESGRDTIEFLGDRFIHIFDVDTDHPRVEHDGTFVIDEEEGLIIITEDGVETKRSFVYWEDEDRIIYWGDSFTRK